MFWWWKIWFLDFCNARTKYSTCQVENTFLRFVYESTRIKTLTNVHKKTKKTTFSSFNAFMKSFKSMLNNWKFFSELQFIDLTFRKRQRTSEEFVQSRRFEESLQYLTTNSTIVFSIRMSIKSSSITSSWNLFAIDSN